MKEKGFFILGEEDIRVLLDLKLNTTETLLYLHLMATAQGGTGAYSYLVEVSSSEITNIINKSRQQISRAKKKLLDIGAIELVKEVNKIDSYGCLRVKKLYKVYAPELIERV